MPIKRRLNCLIRYIWNTSLNINELGVDTNGNRNPAGNQVTYVDFSTYLRIKDSVHRERVKQKIKKVIKFILF